DFRSYPHEGQWVPAAAFETLAGDTVVLGDADSASTEILFTLTASCPYSLASLTAWREIQSQLERVRTGSVAVYFLSLSDRDSTAQFAAEHGIPADRMLLGSDKRMLRIYRIGGGPLTLVF